MIVTRPVTVPVNLLILMDDDTQTVVVETPPKVTVTAESVPTGNC